MWNNPDRATKSGRSREEGYILLEVLIAVMIFAIAVVSMAVNLQKIGETSNGFAQDAVIQHGLESILVEARHRELAEMAFEYVDEAGGIAYRTEIEPLSFSNQDGEAIEGMYTLRASATFAGPGGEETEVVEVYVYKPEQGGRR